MGEGVGVKESLFPFLFLFGRRRGLGGKGVGETVEGGLCDVRERGKDWAGGRGGGGREGGMREGGGFGRGILVWEMWGGRGGKGVSVSFCVSSVFS